MYEKSFFVALAVPVSDAGVPAPEYACFFTGDELLFDTHLQRAKVFDSSLSAMREALAALQNHSTANRTVVSVALVCRNLVLS